MKLTVKDKFRYVVSILMKCDKEDDEYGQVSRKKEIKRFDDDAIESLMAEYAQLDDKQYFDQLMASQLNYDEKRQL